MNLFIVFNNNYSGILQSQVIDRLSFVRERFHQEYHLLVFVSLSSWRHQKLIFQSKYPESTILPIIGGVKFWWVLFLPVSLVCTVLRPKQIVGRAIFATRLAQFARRLGMTRRVVFDGRGAVAAEWEEYLGSAGWPISLESIERIEKCALVHSDLVIGVSVRLFEYWTERYHLEAEMLKGATVIPCLLNSQFANMDFTEENKLKAREQIGLKSDEVVLLFSASKSDWQSLGYIAPAMVNLFRINPKLRLILLSNGLVDESIWLGFEDRVIQDWVDPNDVLGFYLAADFGLLIREETVTNKVAAPVKFAEYLASGLQVIISPSIGDNSDLVKKESLGLVVDLKRIDSIELSRPSFADSIRIRQKALNDFQEERFEKQIEYSFVFQE